MSGNEAEAPVAPSVVKSPKKESLIFFLFFLGDLARTLSRGEGLRLGPAWPRACSMSSPCAAICTRGAPVALVFSCNTAAVRMSFSEFAGGSKRALYYYHASALFVLLAASAVAALKINIDIVASQESNQATDLSQLTLDSLNAAAAKFNLTMNATLLSKTLVFFNASLLSGCIPGYVRFMDGPYCVMCNCSLQRWVAREGGGVVFDLLPFNETVALQ